MSRGTTFYSPSMYLEDVDCLYRHIKNKNLPCPYIISVSSGGNIAATHLHQLLKQKHSVLGYINPDNGQVFLPVEILPCHSIIVVDDIIDGGDTYLKVVSLLGSIQVKNFTYLTLMAKKNWAKRALSGYVREEDGLVKGEFEDHYFTRVLEEDNWIDFFWETLEWN